MGKEYCGVAFSISTSQIGFGVIAVNEPSDFTIHKRAFKLRLRHFSLSVPSVKIFISVVLFLELNRRK